MDDVEFRARTDARLDSLEAEFARTSAKLDEVLQLLHASRLGLGALKGLIYLGLAIIGAWAAFKGVK